jgi:hypothetical protein
MGAPTVDETELLPEGTVVLIQIIFFEEINVYTYILAVECVLFWVL